MTLNQARKIVRKAISAGREMELKPLFVPVPGGVLLRNKAGRVVGAVGVTGDTSDDDAIAAMAGVEAAALVGEIQGQAAGRCVRLGNCFGLRYTI